MMKTTKITSKHQRKGRIVKTEKGSGKSASPSKTPNKTPTNLDKGDKAEESNEVWRWWEEERHDDGVEGTFLEHEKPKADSTKKRKQLSDDEDDEHYEKKPKKKKKKVKTGSGKSASPSKTPNKSPTNLDKGDKAEESNVVWKWWEEERSDDGVEGTFLEHEKPKADSSKKRKQLSDDEDDEDYEGKPKKKKKEVKMGSGKSASPSKTPNKTPTNLDKGNKAEDSNKVWRWWEEEDESQDDGVKWTFLEHKGPVFAPDYEPIPEDVKFYYDGEEVKLSQDTEEVATFYARMLEHDYTTKEVFNHNFMKDWRKVMNQQEKKKIKDLSKCNFKEMAEYFKQLSEERKNRTKEEKKKLREGNEAIQKEYGFCIMDGHKESIVNFRIEPPGLFRGRGDHPKQGMLKRRTMPEDVIINCSKDSKAPKAPDGHKWKEVRHDNKVSWLACWTDNLQLSTKYIILNAASRLKHEDWQKYETARRLHKTVDKIRAQYREEWKSKEMRIRQRAVALYFIDMLALRTGSEKEGETVDTVGCCSLRTEHLTLHEKCQDQENVVEFDFLGKDSIRYYNRVMVEKCVFKNLQLFMENKSGEDEVFDRLNTAILNKYLKELMEGLTAKVFRTYNASRTLQEQLNLLTEPEDTIPAKILSYNRANRAVAILCNHQRAAPKNFSKQMENLQVKIDDKKAAIKEAKKLMKDAKSDYKNHKSEKTKSALEKRKKAVQRLEEQLTKLEVQATDKEENKEIALGTSKLNYLDPRISVAWCKKWEVPIEKIYNKTQREKFRWAIDMATAEFEF